MSFWRSEPARLTATGVSLTLLALTIYGTWGTIFPAGVTPALFDITSYRDTLNAVAGGALMFDWLGYPPVALIVLSPLRGLPDLAGTQLWTGLGIVMALSLAAVVVSISLESRGRSFRSNQLEFLTSFAIAATLLLISAPMQNQLLCGQITLIIITLAFLDASGAVPRRWQGSLVGIAAALKLTPLMFFPYYLVTKQWRQAAMATAAFGVATGIGFALFPRDSLYFWTHANSSGRLEPGRIDNASVFGLLTRWIPNPTVVQWTWVGLALVIGAATYWQARKHFLRGEQIEAALVVGIASTVVSPIAWPHYQVWVVLAALWLLLSRRGAIVALGVGIYLLVTIPFAAFGRYAVEAGIPGMNALWELTVLVPVAISVLGLPRRRLTPAPVPA
jgi:alpha-1,2-mannosyltransferase